jgi:hypothetical protein
MPSCTASNPSHDFMLVDPLCCNDDRAGEIGLTFHFMTRHDLVLTNDTLRTFLTNHLAETAAIDFFTVRTATFRTFLSSSCSRTIGLVYCTSG